MLAGLVTSHRLKMYLEHQQNRSIVLGARIWNFKYWSCYYEIIQNSVKILYIYFIIWVGFILNSSIYRVRHIIFLGLWAPFKFPDLDLNPGLSTSSSELCLTPGCFSQEEDCHRLMCLEPLYCSEDIVLWIDSALRMVLMSGKIQVNVFQCFKVSFMKKTNLQECS